MVIPVILIMRRVTLDPREYVFHEFTVVLTGRLAKRNIETKSRRAKEPKIDVKYEITPANPTNGSWTKWVRMEDLYEILHDGGET